MGANGVVNLLCELPAQHGPQDIDFHNLRLEFLKRVFWGHLQDMAVFDLKEDKEGLMPPDQAKIEESYQVRIRNVLDALDQLNSKQVFMLYKQLSQELSTKLTSLGLLQNNQSFSSTADPSITSSAADARGQLNG